MRGWAMLFVTAVMALTGAFLLCSAIWAQSPEAGIARGFIGLVIVVVAGTIAESLPVK